MIPPVDLVVPVKPLHLAKSRLRGGRANGDPMHQRLALAVAMDTIRAAARADRVRRVVAICSDPAAVRALRAEAVEVVADEPDAGLNPALRHGVALLRAADPTAVVGALQADLPALRPAELDAALAAFAELAGTAAFTGSTGSAGAGALAGAGAAAGAVRAFCPDRHGTGSTLLVAAAGAELDPRFGAGSARAHAESGAVPLDGPWPTLRCDVDTEDDLAEAARLGLGPHTTAALAADAR